MASSVTTNRYSNCSQSIGEHLSIVIGISADTAVAMRTVSNPPPVPEHPHHHLLAVRSDAVFSSRVHSGRSFDEDRS